MIQDPYAALKAYPQFIIWNLIPDYPKTRKVPCDLTGSASSAHDPLNWMSFDEASSLATLMGESYGVGFVFTTTDNLWVIDIDNCLTPDNQWSPIAQTLMSLLPGCLVEVSQSGKGLHLIGSGSVPDHAKKNIPLGLEFYTELRFIALGNMETAVGSAYLDATPSMPYIVQTYFPPGVTDGAPLDWTTEPVAEWNGIKDDITLINKMVATKSAASAFGGGGATFENLWFAQGEALARAFPDQYGSRSYDGSSADASLAQMLAFWTGKNCERMERLMRQSLLVRDKWDREDYLPRTILRACALQVEVHSIPQAVEVDPSIPLAKMKGKSESQNLYAENVRAGKINTTVNPEHQLILGKQSNPSFWIDHADKTPEELVTMLTPAPTVTVVTEPTIKQGLQYQGATQQIEHFKGCIYVISLNKVFTPTGDFLDAARFNARFGGYLFQLDEIGDKTTKKAWEAFTESQLVAYPHADDTWFRPDIAQGLVTVYEGKSYVNTYTPVETERRVGDVGPFLNHIAKLLPVERDQTILISYMAACVQHIGVKFQWCPLIQGAEGNGKSFLTTCLAKSIGERYTHVANVDGLIEKFKGWMFNNLLIVVNDVYTPEHKKEVLEILKPMITDSRQPKRVMNQDPTTGESYANFMLNSNHKNAIQFTDSARRWCPLYCAQQVKEDLDRDGMNGQYMVNLYSWAKSGGYAVINDFLRTYEIPDEFNPATSCQRAPITSSTKESVQESLGSIEHKLLEVIAEGSIGMMGGWISSAALDKLLTGLRSERSIPTNRRRSLLKALGYDYHPGLSDGRVNSPITIDDGKKPRLYIRDGHPDAALTNHGEIVRAYVSAQVTPLDVVATFGGVG